MTKSKVLQDEKWVEIDPKKDYTVLTNSFMVIQEGDGYYWFQKYASDLQNTYATFYSIMAEEVSEHKELTPKAKDGRIIVIH